jgi:hypothetical protein
MKKNMFIILCIIVLCNYSQSQSIQDLITTVYINEHFNWILIDKSDPELSIKVKENNDGFVFLVSYKKIKSKVFLAHSDFINTDSISYQINKYAKKKDVNIYEIDTSSEMRNRLFERCIFRTNRFKHSNLNLFKNIVIY